LIDFLIERVEVAVKERLVQQVEGKRRGHWKTRGQFNYVSVASKPNNWGNYSECKRSGYDPPPNQGTKREILGANKSLIM